MHLASSLITWDGVTPITPQDLFPSILFVFTKSTITHIDALNRKSNQMAHYNHQFPKVKNGANTLQIISGIESESQVTVEWHDLVL